MFGIKSIYTRDHDSIAGYGGRVGYRYKTVVTVQFPAKHWNIARKNKDIGGVCVDVANHLYHSRGFTSTYSPQVDTKARAKKGITEVTFEYFHNNDADAERMEYKGYFKKHAKPYNGDGLGPESGKQWELDPNSSDYWMNRNK